MQKKYAGSQIVYLEPFVYSNVGFEKILPGMSVFSVDDQRIVRQQVTALLVGLKYVIDSTYLEKYPNLRVVASATTGIDHIILPKSVDIIKLDSCEIENVSATSEFAFGLLLSLVRKIPFSLNGNNSRKSLQGMQLKHKTIGIIGFGRLGRNMAKYSEAFMMNVLTFDKTDNRTKLHHLLAESNIISIHVPLSTETIGFIGTDEFLMMRKKPFIINTSRPAIIDRKALIVAVEKELISGIAMDFQSYDPNHSIDPVLSSLPKHKAIFTPHIAGNTVESVQFTATTITQKLADFLGITLNR